MPIEHAVIVGAGVAGLTAALSLALRGVAVDIFEQAEALTEVGAGLQVSPNASRILAKLGVLDRLEPAWLEPGQIRLVSGATLRTERVILSPTVSWRNSYMAAFTSKYCAVIFTASTGIQP